MKKSTVKILCSSLVSLLAGVLITTLLFTSGVIKLHTEEKIEYHLPMVPESIDKTIGITLTDSAIDEPDLYSASLTYINKISDNLKEMSENADLVVRGRFVRNKIDYLYPQPVEYTNSIVRIPLGYYPEFEVTEVLKGELYRRETLKEDSPYYNRITIEVKSNERILLSAGLVEHYADMPDPLYIEPELENEYILFLNKKVDEEYDFVMHSLSEPLYVKLNGDKAELLCNLIDYKGYLKSRCNTNQEDIIEVHYYGTKINLTDDITGKTLDEIKAVIK